MKENLLCPLSEDDVKLIKHGKIIEKHYHNVSENGLLMVFLANKKLSLKELEKPRKAGIDVTSIPIEKQDFKKMFGEKQVLVAHYGDWDICVYPQKWGLEAKLE